MATGQITKNLSQSIVMYAQFPTKASKVSRDFNKNLPTIVFGWLCMVIRNLFPKVVKCKNHLNFLHLFFFDVIKSNSINDSNP